VSGPLIPYIKIPEIPLPFGKPFDSIKPFGVLVATGVYLGANVAVRHARRRGLDVNKMNSFILWVVGLGFVGAHVFDAVFYTPERLQRDPTYLFQIWAGLSSYGGFFGAIFGALAFRFVKKEKVLPLVDTVCSAFPLAWVFGRLGCASVHDHPGRETTSWLGVQYFHVDVHNPDKWGLLWDGMQTKGRFDLGFIEFALTIPLAVAFAVLWARRPRGYGFYAGWQCIFYAPVRFMLDFFRVDAIGGGVHEIDPRYGGLTPAQWACFLLAGIGALMVWFSRQSPVPASWADVKPWTDDVQDDSGDDEEEERPKVKPKKSAAKSVEATQKSASGDRAKDKPGKKSAAPSASGGKKGSKDGASASEKQPKAGPDATRKSERDPAASAPEGDTKKAEPEPEDEEEDKA
jgi:phosphatidylglycerol:prolipoprotein diacylglycerol transferase